MTNFSTIKLGIHRLQDIEAMKEKGIYEALPKKEVAQLEKEKMKLLKVFEGIREMQTLPDVLFVIDPKREHIAVREANKIGIPVVAVVDTNTDPEGVDWIIPGNDDAIKAIRLYAKSVTDAILDGRKVYEERLRAQQKKVEDAQSESMNLEKSSEARVTERGESSLLPGVHAEDFEEEYVDVPANESEESES